MVVFVTLDRFIEGAKKISNILIKDAVRTFQGLRNVIALLDSRADFNFLFQRFVKEQ